MRRGTIVPLSFLTLALIGCAAPRLQHLPAPASSQAVERPARLWRVPEFGPIIGDVSWSADHRFFVATQQGLDDGVQTARAPSRLLLWSASQGRPIGELDAPSATTKLTWCADSTQFLMIDGKDSSARVFNLATSGVTSRWHDAFAVGSRLSFFSSERLLVVDARQAAIVDAATGKQLQTRPLPTTWLQSELSLTAPLIAFRDATGFGVLDVAHGSTERITTPLLQVRWSPIDTRFAGFGATGEVAVWRPASGARASVDVPAQPGDEVEWSRDGQRFALKHKKLLQPETFRVFDGQTAEHIETTDFAPVASEVTISDAGAVLERDLTWKTTPLARAMLRVPVEPKHAQGDDTYVHWFGDEAVSLELDGALVEVNLKTGRTSRSGSLDSNPEHRFGDLVAWHGRQAVTTVCGNSGLAIEDVFAGRSLGSFDAECGVPLKLQWPLLTYEQYTGHDLFVLNAQRHTSVRLRGEASDPAPPAARGAIDPPAPELGGASFEGEGDAAQAYRAQTDRANERARCVWWDARQPDRTFASPWVSYKGLPAGSMSLDCQRTRDGLVLLMLSSTDIGLNYLYSEQQGCFLGAKGGCQELPTTFCDGWASVAGSHAACDAEAPDPCRVRLTDGTKSPHVLALPDCDATSGGNASDNWAPGGTRLVIRHAKADWIVAGDGTFATRIDSQTTVDHEGVPAPQWNDDGTLVAIWRNGALLVWDEASRSTSTWFRTDQSTPSLGLLAWRDRKTIWVEDGARLHLLGAEGELDRGSFMQLFGHGQRPPLRNVSYSPGGRFALEFGGGLTTLTRRDGENLRLVLVRGVPSNEQDAPIFSAFASPQGWLAGDPPALEVFLFARGASLLDAVSVTGRDVQPDVVDTGALERFWNEAPH